MEGFTLAIYWNGKFSHWACPVCYNAEEMGHTIGCDNDWRGLTKRVPDAANVVPLEKIDKNIYCRLPLNVAE